MKKLIIFCNIMQHLGPRGDFPLDVEGGFASNAATLCDPVDEYSVLNSENAKPESASFLERLSHRRACQY